MKSEIEKAILYLTSQIKDGVPADKALKYTQAALNLAHTEHVLEKNLDDGMNP